MDANYASSIATSGSSVAALSPFDAWNEKVLLTIAATSATDIRQ